MRRRRGGLQHGALAFRLTRSRKIPMTRIERASLEEISRAITREAHKLGALYPGGGEEEAVPSAAAVGVINALGRVAPRIINEVRGSTG